MYVEIYIYTKSTWIRKVDMHIQIRNGCAVWLRPKVDDAESERQTKSRAMKTAYQCTHATISSYILRLSAFGKCII